MISASSSAFQLSLVKPKLVKPWLITKDTDNPVNQSKLEYM